MKVLRIPIVLLTRCLCRSTDAADRRRGGPGDCRHSNPYSTGKGDSVARSDDRRKVSRIREYFGRNRRSDWPTGIHNTVATRSNPEK